MHKESHSTQLSPKVSRAQSKASQDLRQDLRQQRHRAVKDRQYWKNKQEKCGRGLSDGALGPWQSSAKVG